MINVIPGEVINSRTGTETMRTPHRNTPNWLRAVYATLAAVVAIVVVSLIFAPPEGDTLPACKYEDGSGQTACYWDADTRGNREGRDVIHYNGTVLIEDK